MVQQLSWPWIFYVNVPLGLLAILIARLVIRESKDTSGEQGLDPAGIVVSAGALFLLIFSLIEGHGYGWGSAIILGSFVLAALAFSGFVALEALQRRPMLSLSIFRNSTFSGANAVTALIMLTMLGVLFFVSLYLQRILGYSAVQAGATFLPLTLIFLLVSPVAGLLGDKIGFRWPVASGMALVGVGMFLFSRQGADASFWDLLPALLVGGIGMGISTAPVTAAAMTATPLEKAGVGAGVLVSCRQTGGALGVAIMGAIVTAKVGDLAPADPRFPKLFVDGFQNSLVAAGFISLLGALIAAVSIRGAGRVEPRAATGERVLRRLATAGGLGAVPSPTVVRMAVQRAQAASVQDDLPALIVNEGPLAGYRYPVDTELSIGRERADIILNDPQISRRHATLRPVNGTCEIADQGSFNGTFVNDERIDQPRRLADGDVVRIGRTSFQVVVPHAVAVETMPARAAVAQPPTLVVSDGPLAGQRFPVHAELSMGRENADITIDDPEVSRRHALLRPLDGGCEIADAGSVNGTFVNDERIDRPRRLADGDVVRIGKTSLKLEVPAPAVEATVPVSVERREAPALVVSDGPLAGERFPVEGELSLGREHADVTLDDPEVSRRHALLRPLEGVLEVADAGSVNGTFVNEERIERPRRLRDGDVVRVGKTSLRVEIRAAGPAATVVSPRRSSPTVLGGPGGGEERRR
jgi:pSer/pThr/pTyr-binding forkhead associated (FHA) protein/predicted MFS family arabinose efflux permease